MNSGGLVRARLARLHEVMAGFVERGEVPGLVALVSRRGEVHVEALGIKALGGSDPIQRDTIFRIASMTKPITAAAPMILVEECKLRLDDPVDELLPELTDRRVLKRLDGPLDDTEPAKRPITLRDLLTFRMGFGIVMAPPGTYPIQTAADDLLLGQGPPQRHLAADASAGRKVGVPHRIRRAGRVDRARLGSAVRELSARTHLRAARHEGYSIQRAGIKARPARDGLLDQFQNRGAGALRLRRGRPLEPAARISVGRRRTGLNRRRLLRLRTHDAEPRPAWRRTPPVAAVGR